MRRAAKSALFALVAAAQLAAGASAGPRSFDAWPVQSASTHEQRVDVEQLEAIGGSHLPILPADIGGQTFVPRRSPLARIDVRLGNAGDQRPGRIAVYRWRGDVATTTAAEPLWSEVIDLSGTDAVREHRFEPGIEVEVGARHFIELSADGRGRYIAKHSANGPDHYAQGRLWVKGRFRPNWDLWFRTWTSVPVTAVRVSERPPLRSLDTSRSGHRARPPREPSRSAVTRRSYHDRIARHANAIRPAVMNACGRKGEETALLEAFLYRASCEAGKCRERHARNVRELYLDAYAWRACARDASLPPRPDPREARCADRCEGDAIDWNPMRRATTAYLWTRESPAYGAADHAAIRAQLANLGRRLWEKREVGTHNRALQYATTYRVLAELLPEVDESAEWRRYSDRVWNELLAAGDTREDSSEYASVVWWPAVLEYAAVSGREAEIFADPRFRSWVERAYQTMTPLGPAADFGHSVGFGRDTAGWVWLFEAAARHYREPRFRHAAQRAFRFHQTQVRDERPAVDALGQTLASLAWAYFAADPTVAAGPPEPWSERVVAERSDGSRLPAPLRRTLRMPAAPLVRIAFRRVGGSARRAEVTVWPAGGDARTPRFAETVDVAADGHIEVRPLLDEEGGVTPGSEWVVQVAPVGGGDLELAARASNGATTVAMETATLAGFGSHVSWRVPARLIPSSERGEHPARTFDVSGAPVPDKLVLRSGAGDDAMFALFNLVDRFGHGEAEQGALVSLVDGGSLLLQDGPYPYWTHLQERVDESRPTVIRRSGGTFDAEPSPTEVAHFRDARGVSRVHLAWREPGGWGARVERRITFVKDRFLLMRDCFTSPEAMRASYGTLLHPTDVAGDHGANWFDLFVRSPFANTFRIRNRPRGLLAWLRPQSSTVVEAFVEPSYLPEAEPGACRNDDASRVSAECRHGPPYVVTQWQTGPLSAAPRCFDTLFVPHAPDVAARTLVEGVRVLRASDTTLALELRIGREEWLVVDDTSGGPIDAPGLAVQARYAVAATGTEAADADATPYVLASDARRLRWRGIDATWRVPVSLEIGPPPTRR